MFATGIPTWRSRDIETFVESLDSKKNVKSLSSIIESLIEEDARSENYLIQLLINSINWIYPLKNNSDLSINDKIKVEIISKRLKTSDNLEQVLEIIAHWTVHKIPLNLIADGFKRFLDFFKMNKENEILILMTIGNKFIDVFNRSDQIYEEDENGNEKEYEVLDVTGELKSLGREGLKFKKMEIVHMIMVKYLLDLSNRLKEFRKMQRKINIDSKLADLIFQQLEIVFVNFEEELLEIKEELEFFLNEITCSVSNNLLFTNSFNSLDIKFEEFYENFDEVSSTQNLCEDGLDLITDSLCLHEILFEMGVEVMNDCNLLEKIIRQFNNIDTLELLKTFIFFLEQNNSNLESSPENQSSFDIATNKILLFDRIENTEIKTHKNSQQWDLELLIKTINKIFFSKISWIKIIESLDSDDPIILSMMKNLPLFKSFWMLVHNISVWFDLRLSYSLFNKTWNHYKTQKIFLISCFELIKDDFAISIPEEMDPRKNLNNKHLISDLNKNFGLKGLTNEHIEHIRDLGPLWIDPAVVTSLIEITEDKKCYNRVSSLLEHVLKKNSQGVLLVLFNCKPKEGLKLFQEILISSLKMILESNHNFSKLIESFYKIDKDLFSLILAKIAEQGDKLVIISKILDLGQNLKESLLTLTKSKNHIFSIKLALLAVKKEYLRLEFWINDRLSECGIEWVEAFLRFITWNLIIPVAQSESKLEKILEESLLSMNSIAIIFENFLLNKEHENKIGSQYIDNICKTYKKIKELIPQLSQVSINDTDNKANELLEKFYEKEFSIENFISELKSLKQSESNRDQEILSCIIINVVDEFRFYKDFPVEELNLTAYLFGGIIKNKIIDGKTCSIIVKAVIDNLSGEKKMFDFAIIILTEIIDNIELSNSHILSILDNQKIYENNFKLIERLKERLEKEKNNNILTKEHIQKFEKKKLEIEEKEMKEKMKKIKKVESNPKKNINFNIIKNENEIIELQKFYSQFSSVEDFLDYKFQELQKEKNIKQEIKDKFVTMMKKFIDPVDSFINEYNKIANSKEIEDWFCNYFFFKKCITEPVMQKLCLSFLMKLKKPKMLNKIYILSMAIVDEIMKYGRFNDITHSKENFRLRHLARWLTIITLSRNKPILRSKLDIRKRILESLMTISVNAFIPMISIIISSCSESKFFNLSNPYIQSLLDLFRELYNTTSVSKESKGFITNLFKANNLKLEDLRPFNYLENNSNSFSIDPFKKSLMNSKIFLDINQLTPILVKSEVKIKECVAIAITNGVKKVIKPVKERSIKNAILTTRIMCKQDLAFENCDIKFLEACKTLAINLTGNLALVTCREPLRTSISNELTSILDEHFKDKNQRQLIKKAVIEKNLNVACEMIYKRVINEVIEEITKDSIIKKEIEKRQNMKKLGNFNYDSEHKKILANLPTELQEDHKKNELMNLELYNSQSNKIGIKNYTDIYRTNQPLISMNMNNSMSTSNRIISENEFRNLIKEIENEIKSENSNEKINNISKRIYQMNHFLKTTKSDIKKITVNQSLYIFKRIKNFNFELEKIRFFVDILFIFTKYNRQITELLAENISNISDEFKGKLDFVISLFKKNLINLKMFDKVSAINLKKEPEKYINGIAQILKKFVIEEKTFDIESFPSITNELQKFNISKSQSSIKKISLVLIENLQNYMKNKSISNKTKFNLSNLEIEYRKIKKDLDEYFFKRKKFEMEIMEKKHQEWFECKNKKDREIYVENFINMILKNTSEKKTKTILVLSYWIEKIYEESISKNNNLPDYTQIDSICCMIIMILEKFDNKIEFIENLMSSIIIIITKYHFLKKDKQILNQKPLFRIIYNIITEINKKKDVFKNYIKKILSIIIHTLRIVQPVKCPAFSFAWLALVSNKFFMKNILQNSNYDMWNNYSYLINGLMLFFKEARGIKKSMTPQIQGLYKATLFFLLVLTHDFPEYVFEQTDLLLEEIPKDFKQFRNIILSATPSQIKIISPDKAANNLLKIEKEISFIQMLPNKIDNRIHSMNIPIYIQSYLSSNDSNEIEKIRDTMYLFDYSGERFINEKIIKSFTFYSVYLLLNKNTKSTKKVSQNGGVVTAKVIHNDQKFQKQKLGISKIFLSLLIKNESNLRESLINSIVDYLRTCDSFTIFFIQLLYFILRECNNVEIEEMIYRTIFERFLIGDFKPWGLTTATFYLTTMFGNDLFTKKYYMENKNLFNQIFNIINMMKKKRIQA